MKIGRLMSVPTAAAAQFRDKSQNLLEHLPCDGTKSRPLDRAFALLDPLLARPRLL
jgi:hypothetical protein